MHHLRAPQTRAFGQDKLPETSEDLETAPEPQLLLYLKPNKTTCFLPRPDFRLVRTHFDLVARLVSARRSSLNPAAVTSFHH